MYLCLPDYSGKKGVKPLKQTNAKLFCKFSNIMFRIHVIVWIIQRDKVGQHLSTVDAVVIKFLLERFFYQMLLLLFLWMKSGDKCLDKSSALGLFL